eukprot:88718_1
MMGNSRPLSTSSVASAPPPLETPTVNESGDLCFKPSESVRIKEEPSEHDKHLKQLVGFKNRLKHLSTNRRRKRPREDIKNPEQASRFASLPTAPARSNPTSQQRNAEALEDQDCTSSSIVKHEPCSTQKVTSESSRHSLLGESCSSSIISDISMSNPTMLERQGYELNNTSIVCNSSISQEFLAENKVKTEHITIPSGTKPFDSEVCETNSSQNGHLSGHLRIHSGRKPHKCEFCQKIFTVKRSLDSHLLIHSGEKPYSCDICQKNFRQKSHLNSHMMIHS